MTPQLCLPLDADLPGARKLVAATSDSVDIFKIGLTTYAAGGRDLVEEIAGARPVFLDLKLHDIPAQVAGAVAEVAHFGISYLTVHASGGAAMVRAAAEAARGRLELLAVTLLTSLDEADLAVFGVAGSPQEVVLRLAELAVAAGASGLVCSPHEVAALRERFGTRSAGGPLLVVPGIRPAGAEQQDQRRTASPEEAVRAGADILVVGRTISESADPAAAAARVKGEMLAA